MGDGHGRTDGARGAASAAEVNVATVRISLAVIGVAVTLGCGSASPAASHAEQLAAYLDTADRMHTLLMYLPVPGDEFNSAAWIRQRLKFAAIIDVGRERWPQPQRAIDLLEAAPAVDAWGSPITATFSQAPFMVLLVSAGPDRRQDSDDDLTGIAVAEKVIEDGRSVWQFRRTWNGPAAIVSAIKEP